MYAHFRHLLSRSLNDVSSLVAEICQGQKEKLLTKRQRDRQFGGFNYSCIVQEYFKDPFKIT